jgi:shikimate dehydrogenase
MHNAAFETEAARHGGGVEYAYVPLAVPLERLAEAVSGLRALGFAGANVTMPYKSAVLPMMDEVDEASRVAGAMNTIVVEPGGLRGLNTDGRGFVEACAEAGVGFEERRVLLLGAGGSAAAVAVAVLGKGARSIEIVNRTPGRAEDLRERLLRVSGADRVSTRPQTEVERAADEADCVINTTYLGMESTDALPLPESALRQGLDTCDVVYRTGAETALVQAARERGARTVSGGRMLLYQGVASQREWTGREPDVEAMSRALG